jgi:hypothetical protein
MLLISSSNENYGYMWWINKSEAWKGVSPDVYFAAGFGGNYIVIDNANDLVVVTRWMDDSKMGDFMKLVEQSITKSILSKHECTQRFWFSFTKRQLAIPELKVVI